MQSKRISFIIILFFYVSVNRRFPLTLNINFELKEFFLLLLYEYSSYIPLSRWTNAIFSLSHNNYATRSHIYKIYPWIHIRILFSLIILCTTPCGKRCVYTIEKDSMYIHAHSIRRCEWKRYTCVGYLFTIWILLSV